MNSASLVVSLLFYEQDLILGYEDFKYKISSFKIPIDFVCNV